MDVNLDLIKQLREETSAGVIDCRTALEASQGNLEKAKEYLRKKGLERADKKSEREVKSGMIYSYIHGGGKIGVLIEVACETDFVARTDHFGNLCKEVSMQIASMAPGSVDDLLSQAYIRDSKLTISDLVKNTVGTLGENIQIRRFSRFVLGEEL